MAKLNVKEVVELEEEIIRLTERIKGLEADPSIPRDYLGTLHVNLGALVREGMRAQIKLEIEHGFGEHAPRIIRPASS